VKTKAAIKRAGGMDPTWQKVEQCHKETTEHPSQEACRFCGKSFPTWKKLTVHLAKHMEQISLPILKLVARKELEADTIISPVQEPPPRSFPAQFPVKNESFDPSPTGSHTPLGRQQMGYPTTPQQQQQQQQQQPQSFMYPIAPPSFQPNLYGNGFDSMSQGMGPTLNVSPVGHAVSHGFSSLNIQAFQHGLPVTTGTYMTSPNQYVSIAPDMEPFPAMTMDALGLQDPNTVSVPYGNMIDPNEQYTPQGSVSPFSHSPHQGHGGFYGP
jgi:hypothetical protein